VIDQWKTGPLYSFSFYSLPLFLLPLWVLAASISFRESPAI
jgi:hypothetical protein